MGQQEQNKWGEEGVDQSNFSQVGNKALHPGIQFEDEQVTYLYIDVPDHT